MRQTWITTVAAFALFVSISGERATAETVRLGLSRLSSCSAVAIALAKGYFTAEGLDPQLSYFDSQQPVAVALTSGDLDFGIAAETSALISLAGDGKLRVIGGGASEAPGFHYLGLYASNDAFAKGLRSPRDIGGHSFAVTQIGTGVEFILSELADKYGFDFKSVRVLPLQSNGVIVSALVGGRTDSAVLNPQAALPLIARGSVKFLAWIGDELGLETAYLLLASTTMANDHGDTVKRLLAAIGKGAQDYKDAFTDERGNRADGPTAPETLAILAKFLGQPVELVEQALPYFDPAGQIDLAYIQRQIDWFRSQGFLKSGVTAETIIDRRYVTLKR